MSWFARFRRKSEGLKSRAGEAARQEQEQEAAEVPSVPRAGGFTPADIRFVIRKAGLGIEIELGGTGYEVLEDETRDLVAFLLQGPHPQTRAFPAGGQLGCWWLGPESLGIEVVGTETRAVLQVEDWTGLRQELVDSRPMEIVTPEFVPPPEEPEVTPLHVVAVDVSPENFDKPAAQVVADKQKKEVKKKMTKTKIAGKAAAGLKVKKGDVLRYRRNGNTAEVLGFKNTPEGRKVRLRSDATGRETLAKAEGLGKNYERAE